MSSRALEFVETWVSEQINDMELPAAGDEEKAKVLATKCLAAARNQGIAESEIKDAFDDLPAFINGQIVEARERAEGSDTDDGPLEEEEDQ